MACCLCAAAACMHAVAVSSLHLEVSKMSHDYLLDDRYNEPPRSQDIGAGPGSVPGLLPQQNWPTARHSQMEGILKFVGSDFVISGRGISEHSAWGDCRALVLVRSARRGGCRSRTGTSCGACGRMRAWLGPDTTRTPPPLQCMHAQSR